MRDGGIYIKKVLLIITLAIIFVIAAITNPSRERFITWEKDQMKSQSNNGLVSWGIDVLGGSILNTATTEQNYVFFTIFDTKVSNTSDIKVLGLFNNFIPLSKGNTGL